MVEKATTVYYHKLKKQPKNKIVDIHYNITNKKEKNDRP